MSPCMSEPVELARQVEGDPQLPAEPAKRVSGYGVMGLPFTIRAVDELLAETVGSDLYELQHDERIVVADVFDNGPECLDTVSGLRETRVPPSLGSQLRATRTSVTLEQDVRLRLLRRPAARRGALARPTFGLAGDRLHRPANGSFPVACDAAAPPFAGRPEVGAEFAAPDQAGAAVGVEKRERLDEVGNRAADDPEVDLFGAVEANRLERGRGSAFHFGEVGGERHVAPALPDLELVPKRARRFVEVREGDQVEDDLAWRRDLEVDGPERLDPAPDAGVERQVAARDEAVDAAAGEESSDRDERGAHSRATIDRVAELRLRPRRAAARRARAGRRRATTG